MRTTDLLTRCTQCRETVLISHDAMQHERLVICPHCGTPAYFSQLLGEAKELMDIENPPSGGSLASHADLESA